MYPGMGPNHGYRPGFPPPHQTPQMMQNFSGRQPLPPGMGPYGPNQSRNNGGMRNNGSQRSGGILSKILGGRGGSGAQAAVNTASNAAAGSRAAGGGAGILQTITNPTNISGFLTNTQKFLNTAGQLGPMVQQYGPMVKNIPSMWKLYRGIKNWSSTSEETDEGNESSSPSPPTDIQPAKSVMKAQQDNPVLSQSPENQAHEEVIKKVDGQSVPKLYI